MAGVLCPRQRCFYRDRCDVYHPTTPTVTAGVLSEISWTKVYSALPCAFNNTQNDSDPEGAIGRIKRRSPLTEDEVRLHSDWAVYDGDYIVYKTTGDPNVNTCFRVMGEPQQFGTAGRRRINEQTLKLMSDNKPPTGVPA